jgi:hypothetical protein
MNEEIYATVTPSGGTFRCVKSQLLKHGGKDPFSGKTVISAVLA